MENARIAKQLIKLANYILVEAKKKPGVKIKIKEEGGMELKGKLSKMSAEAIAKHMKNLIEKGKEIPRSAQGKLSALLTFNKNKKGEEGTKLRKKLRDAKKLLSKLMKEERKKAASLLEKFSDI